MEDPLVYLLVASLARVDKGHLLEENQMLRQASKL